MLVLFYRGYFCQNRFMIKPIHASSIPLSLAAGLIVGAFIGRLFQLNLSVFWVVWLLIFIVLLFAFLCHRLGRILFAVIAGVLCGVMRYSGFVAAGKYAEQFVGQEIVVSGTISSDPKIQEKGTSLTLDHVYLNYSTKQTKSQAYISLSGTKWQFERSDYVVFRGKAMSSFSEYDYYLWHPQLVSWDKPDPPDIALKIRQFLSRNIQHEVADQSSSSLALGFLLGEKTSMPEKLSQQLRVAGLAHVVVASGFALSTLIGFAKKYLQRLSRFAILAGSTLLIFSFLSIAGFTPSLLRAGLASTMSLFAWYYGRRFHPGRLLIYVAALSFLISPPRFFNVAWQLSFASYAGIILIFPLVSKYFYGDKTPGFIATLVLVSLSAQLACLPLSFYYFGTFAVMGVLSNIIVTPIIPVVMLLSFIVALGVRLLPLSFALNQMLSFQIAAIRYIGNTPWATIQLESGHPQYLLLYVPIFIIIFFLKWRTKHDYRPLCSTR